MAERASREELLEGALALASEGYKVLPCGSNKRPSNEHGVYGATSDPDIIRGWAHDGRLKNLAVATGLASEVVVTDADTEEARDRLIEEYGEPHAYTRRGGHWYWRSPGRKVKSTPLGGAVDSKGDGGYVLAAPSNAKRWTDGIPERAALPTIPDELMPPETATTTSTGASLSEELFEAGVEVLAANYPKPGEQYEAGRHLAGYLLGNGVSEDDAFNLMLEALERSPYEVDPDAEREIGRVTASTAKRLAQGEHVTGGPNVEEFVPGLPKKLGEALELEGRRFDLNEVGNAKRMVALFGKELRWCAKFKAWFVWDGQRWRQTEEGPVQLKAEATARAIVKDVQLTSDGDEQNAILRWANRTQSERGIKAMYNLAKARLLVEPEELDRDPYLLNAENGTIDLRTGELRPHDPEDLITKMVRHEFDPKAKAPRFEEFMRQVLDGEELIEFVQRFLGYSLTGSVEERALAVLYGVGKNGKSTLVELFLDILGDYSATTTPETFMRKRFSDASTQYYLAELAGVRFVAVAETEQGAELKQGTVKQITGGDVISARMPYGRPFDYQPQFTIWLSTNHKPEIPDGSEAIWDRLRLVPFEKRFDGAQEDKKLPAKLREEAAGVLAWAVRGCVAWMEEGLGTSAAVEKATAAYRTETDVLEQFFEDCCYFYPEARVTKSDLYEAYEDWCTATGEDVAPRRSFAITVRERGAMRNFGEDRSVKTERAWRGISLGPPSEERTDGEVSVGETPANKGGDVPTTDTWEEKRSNLPSDGPREEKVTQKQPTSVGASEDSTGHPEPLDGPAMLQSRSGGTINYFRKGS